MVEQGESSHRIESMVVYKVLVKRVTVRSDNMTRLRETCTPVPRMWSGWTYNVKKVACVTGFISVDYFGSARNDVNNTLLYGLSFKGDRIMLYTQSGTVIEYNSIVQSNNQQFILIAIMVIVIVVIVAVVAAIVLCSRKKKLKVQKPEP